MTYEVALQLIEDDAGRVHEFLEDAGIDVSGVALKRAGNHTVAFVESTMDPSSALSGYVSQPTRSQRAREQRVLSLSSYVDAVNSGQIPNPTQSARVLAELIEALGLN